MAQGVRRCRGSSEVWQGHTILDLDEVTAVVSMGRVAPPALHDGCGAGGRKHLHAPAEFGGMMGSAGHNH